MTARCKRRRRELDSVEAADQPDDHEPRAAAERAMADLRDATGQNDRSETCTFRKGTGTDPSDPLRKDDGREASAGRKGPVSNQDPGDTIGKEDRDECRAALESIEVDLDDPSMNNDRGETSAVAEGKRTDPGDPLGNDDGSETRAAVEGQRSDVGDAFGYVDSGQTGALSKRTLKNSGFSTVWDLNGKGAVFVDFGWHLASDNVRASRSGAGLTVAALPHDIVWRVVSALQILESDPPPLPPDDPTPP